MAVNFDRTKSVYIANLALQAKRYEDAVEEIKKVVKMAGYLTLEEASILSDGYDKLIVRRQLCWRSLRSFLLERDSGWDEKLVNMYMEKEETEISRMCKQFLSLIDENLIPSCKPQEHARIVFYLTMKGNYFRLVAEFGKCKYMGDVTEKGRNAYEAARTIAWAQLHPTDHIRLGVALTYAIFHFKILFSTERAIEIAKQAYDEATLRLNENTDKTSIFTMKLLKQRITLWNPENYEVIDLW